MKRCVLLFALFAAALGGPALASEGADLRLAPAPIHRLDDESLQRGARNFVNYCLNCHSAKYMRYNRLADLGVDASMIQDNLMFATDKIGATMNVAMTPADGKAWFGATPPDLSVEARVRGTDWLYNYLLGFYRDDKSATGWNNVVFPNVGMPHVLWELSGVNKLSEIEFEDHEKATAAAIAAKGLSLIEAKPGGKYAVLEYQGPIAQIGSAWDHLLGQWLPKSGLQLDSRPMFEHYPVDGRFDEKTGRIECEICVPVTPLSTAR